MENELLTIKERKDLLEGITKKLNKKAYSGGSITHFLDISNEEKIRIKEIYSKQHYFEIEITRSFNKFNIGGNLEIKKGDYFSFFKELGILEYSMPLGIFEKKDVIYFGSTKGLHEIIDKTIYREFDNKQLHQLTQSHSSLFLPIEYKINFDQLIIKYSKMINKK